MMCRPVFWGLLQRQALLRRQHPGHIGNRLGASRDTARHRILRPVLVTSIQRAWSLAALFDHEVVEPFLKPLGAPRPRPWRVPRRRKTESRGSLDGPSWPILG